MNDEVSRFGIDLERPNVHGCNECDLLFAHDIWLNLVISHSNGNIYRQNFLIS